MISYDNRWGTVQISSAFFSELVAHVAQNSFGVSGMAQSNPVDNLRNIVFPAFSEKGVRTTQENGKLQVELHIKVTYGLNIAAAVKSISHKVKYAVEEATGLEVQRVSVCVDDVMV